MTFINFKQNWNLVINEFISINTYKFSKIMFENLQLDYQFQLKQQEDKFNKQIEDLQSGNIKLQKEFNEIIKLIQHLPSEIKKDITKTTGLARQVKISEDIRLLKFDFNKLKNNITLQKLIEDFCLINAGNMPKGFMLNNTNDIINDDPLSSFRCIIPKKRLLEYSNLFKKFLISNNYYTENEVNSEFMYITSDYTHKHYICRYAETPRGNGKVVYIHFSQIQHLIN